MVRDLVKVLDEDKDGKLSEEEFMGYYSHRRMDFDKVCILKVYCLCLILHYRFLDHTNFEILLSIFTIIICIIHNQICFQ